MIDFSGYVVLPSGGSGAWHRIERVEVDLVDARLIVDLASWPTVEAATTGFAAERQRVAIALSEVGVGALPAAIISSLTGIGGPLQGAVESSPTKDIKVVRSRKHQELAAAWNAERTAGVTLGGKTAPTDADSWTRYLALKTMVEDAGTWIDVPIPLADGTFELLTPAKARALWDALKSLERTLLVKLRDKIDAVQAAATVEEIDAISWDN
jgi:hypothetical protein